MNRVNDCRRALRGFSLIEFMVAILLGSILISGAVGVYLGSKRSYTEVEQVATLAENARFSLSVLEESLRHVGFFGGVAGPINVPTALRESGPCEDAAALYDVEQHFLGARATTGNLLSAEDEECIGDALTHTSLVAGADEALAPDVLVIKHLAPEPRFDADPADPSAERDGIISFPSTLPAQDMYVIVNAEEGILLSGADTPPSVQDGTYANGIAYPYRYSAYYLREGAGATPVLARRTLQWDATAGAMVLDTQDLVEGVENMQFLYGVDTDVDADGEVDVFLNEIGVEALTTLAVNPWERVLVVRAFLLLQSAMEDPDYADDRTYLLGDVAYTPGGNRRRLMVSTEISLRNPRLVLRGGA